VITVLFGENSFEIDRERQKIVTGFLGESEAIEGSDVEKDQLLSIFMGQSLFSEQRLVFISGLSERSEYWNALPDWAGKLSDTTRIVLLEGKLDKRTTTYKWLQKNVNAKEYSLWSDRDTRTAESWVQQEATALDIALSSHLARTLVRRVGNDQWRLVRALEKLQLAGEISEETINEHIDVHPEENVFTLLETALSGDLQQLQATIAALKETEDAYKVVGLLVSQLMQLTALVYGDKPSSEVAKDIKANPYVLNKLAAHAQHFSKKEVSDLLKVAATADIQMKSVAVDPWIPVEQLLLTTAQSRK